jgi:hypothetical protein
MELLDLFQDPGCMNWVMMHIREPKAYMTRSVWSTQTISCRVWQLVSMVMEARCTSSDIHELQSYCIHPHESESVQRVLVDIKRIMDIVMTEKTPLYSIITENRPRRYDGRCGIQPIHAIEELSCRPNTFYPLCIYTDDAEYGGILHYFTIVYDGTTYFSLSSYGSDYVHVPQYISKVDPHLFNEFCVMITIPVQYRPLIGSRYNRVISHFITTHFLSHGTPKRYDEDTVESNPALKSKWLEPEKGMEMELDVFLKNQYTFSVGYIHGYDTEIQRIIASSKFAGKKRRSWRRCTHKRKHSRRTR